MPVENHKGPRETLLRGHSEEKNFVFFLNDAFWCTGWSKKCPNLFLSELREISTKFDNFWHTDGKNDRIM